VSAEGGTRAVVAALLSNLGIAASKLVAAVLTGSGSMLAEAVHSLADSGNQLLLLLGSRSARRLPDAEHPFGHGPARYFYAFVVAVVLFTLGALFALVEGVNKLRHPHQVNDAAVAFGVLVVSIALESLSFRTAVAAANPARGGRSWWAFIRQSKSPELPVVLLEDAAALVGLALALVGLALTSAPGDGRWDAVATLAIAALLGAVAAVLAVEMRSLLIGEAASAAELEAIRAALVDGVAVLSVIHLRTMHLGPEELLLGAKVEMDQTLVLSDVAKEIDAAEARVRAVVPSATLMYVEPDVRRGPEAQ
jgi:cation diffusion facilitator family transporter